MIADRLEAGKHFLSLNGVIFINIDDHEVDHLRMVLNEVFGREDFLASIVWQKRTSPDGRINLGPAQDYILAYCRELTDAKNALSLLPVSDERAQDYKNPDNDPRGVWASVDLTGQTGHATPDQFYTIVNPRTGTRFSPPPSRCWAMAESTVQKLIEDNRIWFGKDGTSRPRLKLFLSESKGITTWTWWSNTEVGHNQEATKELANIVGQFDASITPKPLRLLRRIIQLSTGTQTTACVLDYFAGAGTTGHAVINMNREDNGKRRYILVEMGTHFHDIILPRLKKAVFSSGWKECKPVSNDGISHLIKYHTLEQYEDTLNNIELPHEADGHEALDVFGDDYLLRYMLDFETQGSACLLNLELLSEPFDYRLKVKQNGAVVEQPVDLVETFNYLLGLQVQRLRAFEDGPRTYRTVLGEKDGKRIVVVWRNAKDLAADETLLAHDRTFIMQMVLPALLGEGVQLDRLFINGAWSVPSAEAIETEFHRLMWEGATV